MLKTKIKGVWAALLVSLSLGCFSSAHATFIFDPQEIKVIADRTSSVEYTFFEVFEAGSFSFSANRTETSDVDTFLRLFVDDGSTNFGEQLAVNDDGGPGLNSLIRNLFLEAGNYVLAVGDFFLSESEARSGANLDDADVEFGGVDVFISSQDGLAFAVPEPGTLAMFSLILGAGLMRRKLVS